MICRWVEEGPGSEAHKLHVSRVRDFFWMGAKGMTICGAYPELPSLPLGPNPPSAFFFRSLGTNGKPFSQSFIVEIAKTLD